MLCCAGGDQRLAAHPTPSLYQRGCTAPPVQVPKSRDISAASGVCITGCLKCSGGQVVGPFDPAQQLDIFSPPMNPEDPITLTEAATVCNAASLSGYLLAACIFDVVASGDPSFADASIAVNTLANQPGVPSACVNPFYVIDGFFDEAWSCVQPAVGRFTYAYFNYVNDPSSSKDGFLYILNDWMLKDNEPAEPDCFNEFRAFTGDNKEQWVIRVYGDQSAEAILNGEVVQPRTAFGEGAFDVIGAAGYGPSPNSLLNHTIFELRFPASKGTFKVQLKDPGPSTGCVLVDEPNEFSGFLVSGRCWRGVL